MMNAELEDAIMAIIAGQDSDEAAAAKIAQLAGDTLESAALTVSLERHGHGDVLPPPAEGDTIPAPPPAPVEPGHTPDPIPEGVDIQQHGELGPVIADPSHDFSTQQK